MSLSEEQIDEAAKSFKFLAEQTTMNVTIKEVQLTTNTGYSFGKPLIYWGGLTCDYSTMTVWCSDKDGNKIE
jgi:hypothetical protein